MLKARKEIYEKLEDISKIRNHTSQLVQRNAFLVASAEVCASHLQGRTPSQGMKTFPIQNVCINLEGMGGLKTAVSLSLSEHEAISFGLPGMPYP